MDCSLAMIERVKKCSMFGICIQFTRANIMIISLILQQNKNNQPHETFIQHSTVAYYSLWSMDMHEIKRIIEKGTFFCFNINIEHKEFPIQKMKGVRNRAKYRRSISSVDRARI